VQEHLVDVLGGYDKSIARKVVQDNPNRMYQLGL
jgi:hypothetical protein